MTGHSIKCIILTEMIHQFAVACRIHLLICIQYEEHSPQHSDALPAHPEIEVRCSFFRLHVVLCRSLGHLHIKTKFSHQNASECHATHNHQAVKLPYPSNVNESS